MGKGGLADGGSARVSVHMPLRQYLALHAFKLRLTPSNYASIFNELWQQ